MRFLILCINFSFVAGCLNHEKSKLQLISNENPDVAGEDLKATDFSFISSGLNSVFQIASKNSRKCLTIIDLDAFTSPVAQGCKDSIHQKFEYEGSDLENKRLRSLYSGKCLDIENESQSEGGKVIQNDCLPFAKSQNIQLRQNQNLQGNEHRFSLVFSHADKDLTLVGDKYYHKKTDGSKNQEFIATRFQMHRFVDKDAKFKLINDKNKQCLSVGSKKVDEPIRYQVCSEDVKQYFRKIRHGNNRVSLQSVFSNNCIDIDKSEENDKNHVVQKRCEPNLGQIFEVVKKESVEPVEGYHHLVELRSEKINDKCLDLGQNLKDEGLFLALQGCAKGPASGQRFRVQASSHYAFDESETAHKVTKKIWAFWDSGEDHLPILYQLNLEHWKKVNPDWQVRIINIVPDHKDNIFNILNEYGKDAHQFLPSNWDQLEKLATPFKNSHGSDIKADHRIVKSDLIRLAILEVAGGVYSDLSNMMLVPLDEFFVKSFDQSSASVAGYSMQRYASPRSPKSNGLLMDGFENWMIAAKMNSPFISAWRKAFVRYWETRGKAQPTLTHPMYADGTFDPGGMGFDQSSYLNEHAAFKYTLQNYPTLASSVFIVDWNPWFIFEVQGSGGDQITKTLTTAVQKTAKKIRSLKIPLLKFSSEHLHDFNKEFKTRADFCNKSNIFRELYALTCEPR